MDFNLTEDQKLLQATVRECARDKLEPIAEQLERTSKLPDDLIKRFAQIGLLGMTTPQKYGGTETGNLSCALTIERLAYSGTGAWWLVSFNNGIAEGIARFGAEVIKGKYLKPFCDGTAYASLQFTEAETGSDPDMLTTTCVLDGDSYVINGGKRFSTFGAREGYAILYAKDEEGNCTAFVIEKRGEGYSTTENWELMGGGGLEVVDVYFENFRVPPENLLGKKGQGMETLSFVIASEKLAQCAAATGIAQAALDEALKYVKTRMSRGG